MILVGTECKFFVSFALHWIQDAIKVGGSRLVGMKPRSLQKSKYLGHSQRRWRQDSSVKQEQQSPLFVMFFVKRDGLVGSLSRQASHIKVFILGKVLSFQNQSKLELGYRP
ncbi:hypothetical protein LIER_16601 [Lithospermum erythrorhizon]|uniref:Uncharacterized protein n=1 Tax=Lithospermum erythrorhizon TaxID=34254 RepID=A0AAV3Q9T1_LITER